MSFPSLVRSFQGLALAAGVLSMLMVAPFVFVPALVGRTMVDSFLALPSDLPEPRLPQRSQILAADGSLIANVFLQNRQVVAFDQVAPVMKDAFLAVEDDRFYSHPGVDYKGLSRAALVNILRGRSQGASTLTQQYVKNALVVSAENVAAERAATVKTGGRKLQEMRYALELERTLTKDEIFGRYLNIVYFGDGAYGVEGASVHYFNKSSSALTLPEAALLAGIVKNPSAYDPTRNPVDAQGRRDVVLARMLETGRITQAEHDAAVATPVVLAVTDVPNGCETAGDAGFYCDWVRRTLEADPALGETREERSAALLSGGLVIRTPLDRALQARVQAIVDDAAPRDSRVAASVVVVKPGTGEVRAMVVNRTFGTGPGQTVFPLASSPSYQPGSTFKTFTLAAALEQGAPLSLELAGGECHRSLVFDNPQPRGCFSNAADGEGGRSDMRKATADSVNTWFVQLQERTGTLPLAEMATRLGVTSLPLEGEGAINPKEGALTLGSREVSPLDMANAYATLAARGVHCTPVAVTEITLVDGTPGPVPSNRCEQVVSPAVADGVTSLLTSVITDGTARRNGQVDRPAAGKTGTTSDYGAAWFDGYTPDYATAVVLADPRGPSYALRDVLGYDRMFGGDLPTIIWSRVMRAAHEGVPVSQFVGPDANVSSAGPVLVPDVRGLPAEQARAVLEHAGLEVSVVEAPEGTALLPAGVALTSTPGPGSPVRVGSSVELVVKQ